MHSSTVNEGEEVNFIIRDLQYSSVLVVPFYTLLLHQFYSYFGKINVSVSAPAILGYIYYIIIIIQSFLPAFLIDCEDLWPPESLLTTIVNVLGYFYQGPQASIKSARIPMSFVISIIFIILFAILIIRSHHYKKTGRFASGEIKFIYFTFKYIMPLFCPHLMSGVVISFDQIINQNKIDYNILQIILSILTFLFYMYILYAVITPRVLLEDTPSHDWFPFLTVATIANTTLLSVVSGISGCVDNKNRCGCSIWMLIQSFLVGFVFFFSNGVVKTIIGVISSSTFFTSCFTSLLLTIDIIITKPISPEILFITSCIVFIVLIVLLKLLKQHKVTRILMTLDNMVNSDGIFESVYKKPLNFMCDIQSVIETWIQFAGNFELFETAVEKWPDNFNLLILYSRLLAIYPNKSQLFISTASRIASLKKNALQNAYVYQFKCLLGQTRQTSMTPSFRKKLDQVNSKSGLISEALKRFWEGVLQKNSANFWSDSDHVFSQINDLDSLFAQLLDDYPNNYQLLKSYHYFVTKIKRDFNESIETARKLESLKQNGSIKSNFAYEIGAQVFPVLNNCIQTSESSQIQNSNDRSEYEENGNNQLQTANDRNEHEASGNNQLQTTNDRNEHEASGNNQLQTANDRNEHEASGNNQLQNTNDGDAHEENGNIRDQANENANNKSEVRNEGEADGSNEPQSNESSNSSGRDEANELKQSEACDSDGKDISNSQLETALTELIDHSKLGTIWIISIILIIATVVVIVLFYLYEDYYVSHYVDKQRDAIEFLSEVHMLVHSISFFCININILPLTFENDVPRSFSITNNTLFTEQIAPELFAQGKIPEFSLTSNSLTDLLSTVLGLFEKMTTKLSSLNKDEEHVQQMNHFFYVDKHNGSSLNDHTINLINTAYELLKVSTHSDFYDENSVYYSLQSNFYAVNELYSNLASIAHSYASSGYGDTKLNELMILVLLVAFVFIVLPYVIQLLILSIQSNSIVESFTLLPNTEIRSIINSFGKESSKIEEEEDTTQIVSLNNIKRSSKLSCLVAILVYLSSFILVLICSLVIYFDAKKFVDTAESVSLEIYTLAPAFSALSFAFTQALRFYMLAHDGNIDHMKDLDLNLYGSANDNLTDIIELTFDMLNLSYKQFADGMWGANGGMDVYSRKNEEAIDYFNNSFNNEDDQIAPKKSFFEELATDSFTESIGHILDFLWFFTIDMKAGVDQYEANSQFTGYLSGCSEERPELLGILYWLSNFSEINRTQIYFNLVQEDVNDKIKSTKLIPSICLYVVIGWQLLACLLMFLFLLNKHSQIKRSLLFYKYIKPETILQNQKVLSLIERGRQIDSDNDVNLSNADYIMTKISQGVVVTEKNFTIRQFNESFIQKCQLNDYEQSVNGQLLTELFTNDNKDKSWPNLVQHVEDSISGKHKTQFKEDVTVKLRNGQVCHFSCTVICMSKNRVSNGGDNESIDKVAFIFDDNTEVFMKEKLIEKEKAHLNKMLANVMPSRLISNFVNSGECISFIVQSVSIGMIRIKALKKFDNDTCEAFNFYSEIFDRFDAEIKQFDLLTKISNFSHTYSFIGGLFSEINKPERHAEEAIKFSLKLLSIVPELSDKYGVEIHLTIGVHTGGPIIAGVLSFDKPTFQIIGAVSDMASQVKNKGVPDQICITRAVYELIFSASFKVQEQGDTQIRGGKVIPTYLVRL